MGRGGRAQPTLDLKALPATYDPQWLTALTAFERALFHPQAPACNPAEPYADHRFVVLGATATTDGAPPKHSYEYYETPEALLAELVLRVRDFLTHYQYYVLEYHPSNNTFALVNILGSATGYAPAPSTSHKDRITRLYSVAKANDIPNEIKDANKYARFICVDRVSYGGSFIHSFAAFNDAVRFGASRAFSFMSFVAFYDLDVRDQPIPLRFSLPYTDANGATYEVSEPA